ncbi:MAG: hypothetical protein K940chlam9_00694 [Chlamydiae bacterium]|nr:hypothetical protein [Chlamydiota bacterium]
MPIRIDCANPCFIRYEQEQTTCTHILRISAVSLGGIAIVVGILALSIIPRLNTLGIIGGTASLGVGFIASFLGVCIRYAQEEKKLTREEIFKEHSVLSEFYTVAEIVASNIEELDSNIEALHAAAYLNREWCLMPERKIPYQNQLRVELEKLLSTLDVYKALGTSQGTENDNEKRSRLVSQVSDDISSSIEVIDNNTA